MRAAWIRLRSEGDGVVVEVEDHGVGLDGAPEAALAPFAGLRPGRGGLGLTRCARWIAEGGGRLSLSPRPEGGTVARLHLELAL